MKVISSIQLGKYNTYQIETEGENLFEAIYQLGGVHNISKCGLCGKDYLSLRSMKTEGDFEYLKVVCGGCNGSVTFGKTKKDGIMYYRRKDGKLEWEKYEKKTDAEQAANKAVPPNTLNRHTEEPPSVEEDSGFPF